MSCATDSRTGSGWGSCSTARPSLRGLATRALWLGRRTDVYVGCAPRTRRHGGRDAIERAFVLWADCDGEHAVDALERFDPQPPVVIASGTGRNRHAFWPLTEPLAADEVERGNRRLAHALGADPASADAARILRVPATSRTSTSHRCPSTRSGSTSSSACDAADVVGGLPDPPQRRAASRPPVPGGHRGDDPLLSIEPAVYVQRLLSVEVPRHRKVACPFHPDRHPSLHVYDTASPGLVLLRALQARRHDLRPRRTAVRL